MKDPGRMFYLRQGERSPTPLLDSGSGAGMTVRRGFHGEMVQSSSTKPLRIGVEGSA